MNNLQILQKLNKIAQTLDLQGNYEEATNVTNVMHKIAQTETTFDPKNIAKMFADVSKTAMTISNNLTSGNTDLANLSLAKNLLDTTTLAHEQLMTMMKTPKQSPQFPQQPS